MVLHAVTSAPVEEGAPAGVTATPQGALVVGGEQEELYEQLSNTSQPLESPCNATFNEQEELKSTRDLPLDHNGGEHIENRLLFPDSIEEDNREQEAIPPPQQSTTDPVKACWSR